MSVGAQGRVVETESEGCLGQTHWGPREGSGDGKGDRCMTTCILPLPLKLACAIHLFASVLYGELCMPRQACEGQQTLWESVLPFHHMVLGNELRRSGLGASAFVH